MRLITIPIPYAIDPVRLTPFIAVELMSGRARITEAIKARIPPSVLPMNSRIVRSRSLRKR